MGNNIKKKITKYIYSLIVLVILIFVIIINFNSNKYLHVIFTLLITLGFIYHCFKQESS